jgi:hypothetical protein
VYVLFLPFLPLIPLRGLCRFVPLISPTSHSGTDRTFFYFPQHFDFVYAVENAYFLTPFAAISLVAEGGASLSLVQRMGVAKANECASLFLSPSLITFTDSFLLSQSTHSR